VALLPRGHNITPDGRTLEYEVLPIKYKALNSNPRTTKKKKGKEVFKNPTAFILPFVN
jgi:hypothetical protein